MKKRYLKNQQILWKQFQPNLNLLYHDEPLSKLYYITINCYYRSGSKIKWTTLKDLSRTKLFVFSRTSRLSFCYQNCSTFWLNPNFHNWTDESKNQPDFWSCSSAAAKSRSLVPASANISMASMASSELTDSASLSWRQCFKTFFSLSLNHRKVS